MTRCKFTCMSITKRVAGFNGHPFVYDARFSPVHAHSYRHREPVGGRVDESAKREDEKFWAATPSGEIVVGTIAADHFQVGQDYYIDFTPVPAGGAS